MTYKTRYGFDWPADMPDELIGLVIGKKWREFKEQGIEFTDPWEPMLSAMHSLYGDALVITPWTEQHVHDWVMEPFLLTFGCASSGKGGLFSDTVFFPDRAGTYGEVKVGDKVMAATGYPVEVIGIRDQVNHPLCRVTFEDDTSVVCTKEHLWTVSCSDWNGKKNSDTMMTNGGEKFVRTVSAEYLASLPNERLRKRVYSITTTRPVEFTRHDVPVDPYVLGCLLGDGCVTGNGVRFASHPVDIEARNHFTEGLPAELELVPRSSFCLYDVVKKSRKPGSGPTEQNTLVSGLKQLGLWGHTAKDKFVPGVYKMNSVNVREELLAGLLDTDGSVQGVDSTITFSTISNVLAEDVRFLVNSLGGHVKVHERTPKSAPFRASDPRVVMRQPLYTVTIKGLPENTASRLFHLSRKRIRVHTPRHAGLKSIRSVEHIRNREDYEPNTRCLVLAKYDDRGNEVNGLYVTNNFTVTHNSNDTGALIIADFITDPYDTVTLVGSTTRDALKLRTWESVQRYFRVLKQSPKFAIPGKESLAGCAILNDRQSDDSAGAAGGKAGIHGTALNDGGTLQGAHLRYVRLVVDELATLNSFEQIDTAIENLSITKDFRFIGLANPESWSHPSNKYAIPENGIDSVDKDTGSWRSTFGCFVRHHNGLKSPCVLDPSLESKYPFLTNRRHVEAALKRAAGNPDSRSFNSMIIGYPLSTGSSGQTVLDEAIATRNHASDPAPPGDRIVDTAAGIDPAWTENGDNACYARCYLKEDMFGKPYLDFTNGLRKMTLNSSDFKRHPAVEQLRNQVINFMREPYAAPFRQTAIDSSGNQGLADDLIIYAAAQDVMSIKFDTRASEEPLRAFDQSKTKDQIYDRGTEAWCVLAEFIRAGQVRGLPQVVVESLVNRRYAANMVKDASGMKVPAGVKYPLRLEKKEEFKARNHGRSPDECDACALAALAIKERCGLQPFGYIKRQPSQNSLVPDVKPIGPVVRRVSEPDFGTAFDDTDDLYGDV